MNWAMETWTHRVELSKVTGRDFITATAGLFQLDSNERPYFNVTADIWHGSPDRKGWSGQRRRHQGLEADTGGCCHDEILKAFPRLAPVVALHLSDDEGVPMHAVANGWHFYSGQWHAGDRYNQARGRTPMQVTAEHLHVSESDIPLGMTRAEFSAFVDTLRPRWKAQADEAIALLDSLARSMGQNP